MTDLEYYPVQRDYKEQFLKIAMARSTVSLHPLLPSTSKRKQELHRGQRGTMEGLSIADPLQSDPLQSRILVETYPETNIPTPIKNQNPKNSQTSQSMLRAVAEKAAARTPWQLKKEQILTDSALLFNVDTSVGVNVRDKDSRDRNNKNSYSHSSSNNDNSNNYSYSYDNNGYIYTANSYDKSGTYEDSSFLSSSFSSSSSPSSSSSSSSSAPLDKYALRLASLEKKYSSPTKSPPNPRKNLQVCTCFVTNFSYEIR